VMAFGERTDRLRQPGDRGIGKGHNVAVYVLTVKRAQRINR
jgi:hypothetical protein